MTFNGSVQPSALFVKGDASRALLLADADLFQGVGGERVRRGDQRGLCAVTSLVSEEPDLSDSAVREGEPVEKKQHGNERRQHEGKTEWCLSQWSTRHQVRRLPHL